MSLNLLLGYTGQLSLGHVAFFGIGAYTSALTTLGFDLEMGSYTFVHDPWPTMVGFTLAVIVAGLCGYLIGKLSFTAQNLVENASALLDSIVRAKPSAAKGKYLKSITVSSTMGPGVRVDETRVEAAAKR